MNPATALAAVLADELVRCGLREAVLAPGSRSTPLALALYDRAQAGELRLHVRIDERSAAFLALGLGKASGRPAAVLCTSGTAAGPAGRQPGPRLPSGPPGQRVRPAPAVSVPVVSSRTVARPADARPGTGGPAVSGRARSSRRPAVRAVSPVRAVRAGLAVRTGHVRQQRIAQREVQVHRAWYRIARPEPGSERPGAAGQ